MTSHRLVITTEDHHRQSKLLDLEMKEISGCESHLDDLLNGLHRASVVDPADMPGDVVTIESVVELSDVGSSEREIVTLVYPDSENVKASVGPS